MVEDIDTDTEYEGWTSDYSQSSDWDTDEYPDDNDPRLDNSPKDQVMKYQLFDPNHISWKPMISFLNQCSNFFWGPTTNAHYNNGRGRGNLDQKQAYH